MWRDCEAYNRLLLLQLLNTLATDLDYMLTDLCTTPPPPYENGDILHHDGDIAHIRYVPSITLKIDC